MVPETKQNLEHQFKRLMEWRDKLVGELGILEKRKADAIKAVYDTEFSYLKEKMDKRQGMPFPYGNVISEETKMLQSLKSKFKVHVLMNENYAVLLEREEKAKQQVWDYLKKKDAYNVKLQAGIEKRYEIVHKIGLKLESINSILNPAPIQTVPETAAEVSNAPKVETY